MGDHDPYRDAREGQRIQADRLREEREERTRFAETLRPRGSSRRSVLLVLFVLMCGAGLLIRWLRGTDVTVGASAQASSSASAVSSSRLAPLTCEQLAADYHARLDKARVCTQDGDCIAEARAELMTALDGCARFVTRSKDLLVADERARQWQARGCANAYRTCAPARGAICEAHVCVEKPPPELPRTWHRVELPGVFSFFVPGDVVGPEYLPPEDSWVTRLAGHGIELTFDVQRGQGAELELEGGVPEGEPDTIVVRTELLMLGGSRARLQLTRPRGADANSAFGFTVVAPRVPSQKAPGSPYELGTVAVFIRGTCNTKTSCDEIVKALGTFEAW